MTKNIVIAGSGFAGMWAAVSAARAVALTGREQDIEVIIVSPSARLAIWPRLYEAVLENMNPNIAPLLEAVGVRHIAGLVQEQLGGTVAFLCSPAAHQITGTAIAVDGAWTCAVEAVSGLR